MIRNRRKMKRTIGGSSSGSSSGEAWNKQASCQEKCFHINLTNINDNSGHSSLEAEREALLSNFPAQGSRNIFSNSQNIPPQSLVTQKTGSLVPSISPLSLPKPSDSRQVSRRIWNLPQSQTQSRQGLMAAPPENPFQINLPSRTITQPRINLFAQPFAQPTTQPTAQPTTQPTAQPTTQPTALS